MFPCSILGRGDQTEVALPRFFIVLDSVIILPFSWKGEVLRNFKPSNIRVVISQRGETYYLLIELPAAQQLPHS